MKSWHKLLAAGCLALPLLLSACESADEASGNKTENSASSESDPNRSTSSQSEVKSVQTVNGEIEIPAHPLRIVAEEYLGSLIPLEVIPVGAPGLTLNNVYFKEALKGVADTGDYGKMNLERILDLNPDLILSANNDNYAQLSKIAPTVVVPWGNLKNAHEELTYFGELLDKREKAAAWLQSYDERIAAARARVEQAIPAEASFSILEVTDKSIFVYGDNFGRGGQPVYQALGRKAPEKVAAEIMEKQWAEISAEKLPDYAGDYLVITSNNLTLEDLRQDPMWGTLPAIKNGQVYVWKEERSWYYDPVAVLSQTEELAAWLAPAV
ncbi:ABC transporter substrate-binding protein [Paenibacillus sp. GM2]|uniref:ABC transporter substrate-binding protein n=1 Tax=Paenibacillus sp. GM2 TaxID=1622070 RepID=UPI00083927CA|nr:ABC transporter substrate-binding protein [Paenibacillus sp. GM2]